MSSLPPLGDSTSFSPKSFWEKTEGTWGMAILAIIAAVGVIGFFAALPFLTAAFFGLAKLISAVGAAIVAGAVVSCLGLIVFNKKTWTLLDYVFKARVRQLTNFFVTIDPIGIMNVYIDKLKARLEKMNDTISKLRGQIRVCENKILEKEKAQADAMNQATVAHQKSQNAKSEDDARRMKMAFALNARTAGRVEQSTVTYKSLLAQMKATYDILVKYQEVADFTVKDLEGEVEEQSDKRKFILNATNAIKEARAIINGESSEKALFDQAMEYTVEDYGRRVGEIEHFLDSTQHFVDGLDIQNGVFEKEALERMQKLFDESSTSMLIGDAKRVAVEKMTASAPVSIPTAGGEFNKFFTAPPAFKATEVRK